MKFYVILKVLVSFCFFYNISSVAQQEIPQENPVKVEENSRLNNETQALELNYNDYLESSYFRLNDEGEASKAPDIKTFATDPNQLGVLANSVI